MDMNFDKKTVNKESVKDAGLRRKARSHVKTALQERCVLLDMLIMVWSSNMSVPTSLGTRVAEIAGSSLN